MTLREAAHGWRSWHFVPGASDRMLARAADLPADVLLLDLEDAVPADGKPAARERVARWLAQAEGRAARIVRINPLATPWGRDDLAAAAAHADAVMAPKVESRADLVEIDAALGAAERATGRASGDIGVAVIATETARAVLRLEEIADGPRVIALTWGAEDLSAALGASGTRDADGRYLEPFRMARTLALLAAHAAGVAAIDGVYTSYRDVAGLRREAAEAAASGFTGKLTIHPSQIDAVNDAFTPSPEAVRHARELLDAVAAHEATGAGAFAFRGEMVDAPHLARARALLERAERAERS